MEASSTEEPAAGTPSSVKKSPSDSIPGGGEKCIESPDPDRVHGSFKSAEKKTFTVVKKEQPEVKREPSESPKRREGSCGDSGRLQELRDGVQYGRKFWRKGETVTCLARTLQIIERLRMIEILANYFCSVVLILSPDDLLAIAAVSVGASLCDPNHDGFNEPVANALSKCEKAFEGEGGGHCVGAEDGVRQPDCTVAAGGRGGLPGGQVFDDAGNTVEVHVGASDQGRSGSVGAIRREGFKCELKYDGDRALFHLLKDGSGNNTTPGRDCPDGPHSEGFAKEYIPGLLNIVGVEQISPRRTLVKENLKRSINIQQQAAGFAVTALRLMMDKEKGRSKGFGYIQYVEATGATEAMARKNRTETEGGDGYRILEEPVLLEYFVTGAMRANQEWNFPEIEVLLDGPGVSPHQIPADDASTESFLSLGGLYEVFVFDTDFFRCCQLSKTPFFPVARFLVLLPLTAIVAVTI
ncbi:conserved hypothetical protein [Culex quinquefasciatus]|uniref:RRM domain-containing protein n=1 Tax=Culex quinquefasciatus TaxID=7176 RepID=B0X7R7_CULQU|nr:conserved hypothetical protein [Culex quinquefasciatus]|eukprot:XP_001865689.1 conserved hypothetical protein [Culex quinquefasciatus]